MSHHPLPTRSLRGAAPLDRGARGVRAALCRQARPAVALLVGATLPAALGACGGSSGAGGDAGTGTGGLSTGATEGEVTGGTGSGASVGGSGGSGGSVGGGTGGGTGPGGEPAMVFVPAGPFWMGCDISMDPECSELNPRHQVNLDAYWIDTYEVTVQDYAPCVDAGACMEPQTGEAECNWGVAGREDHPVNCVFWGDAWDYCLWAGKRLPTEAEWEKAARSDDERWFPWGNEPITCERANWEDDVLGIGCGTGITSSVGSHPLGVSPYGAHDMAGNVLEYVSDWYASDYYDVSPVDNPTGPEGGMLKVARSSSFTIPEPVNSRTWKRYAISQKDAFSSSGFRCAKTPE